MARDVSEREFVNYAKGLGNYCTYSDARGALVGVLQALAVSYPSFVEPLGDLLPAGVRGLLAEAMSRPREGVVPTFPPQRDDFLEILRMTSGLCLEDRPGHALRSFLGTVKEKSQDLRGSWDELIPPPLRVDWDQSITIDQVQDPGQCL